MSGVISLVCWTILVYWTSLCLATKTPFQQLITKNISCQPPEKDLVLKYPLSITNDTIVLWTSANDTEFLFATKWLNGKCEEFSTDITLFDQMIRNTTDTCSTFFKLGDDITTPQKPITQYTAFHVSRNELRTYFKRMHTSEEEIKANVDSEYDGVNTGVMTYAKERMIARLRYFPDEKKTNVAEMYNYIKKLSMVVTTINILDTNKTCTIAKEAFENTRQSFRFLQIQKNKPLTLPCKWSVSNHSRIRWRLVGLSIKTIVLIDIKHKDETVQPTKYYNTSIFDTELVSRIQLSSNLSLIITNLTSTDCGLYIIEYTDAHHTIYSQLFLVTVDHNDKTSWSSTSSPNEANELTEEPIQFNDWGHVETKRFSPGDTAQINTGTLDANMTHTTTYYHTIQNQSDMTVLASITSDHQGTRIVMDGRSMDRFRFTNKGQTLHITQLSRRDNGIYTGITRTPNNILHRINLKIWVSQNQETVSSPPHQHVSPDTYDRNGSDLTEDLPLCNAECYGWYVSVTVLIVILIGVILFGIIAAKTYVDLRKTIKRRSNWTRDPNTIVLDSHLSATDL